MWKQRPPLLLLLHSFCIHWASVTMVTDLLLHNNRQLRVPQWYCTLWDTWSSPVFFSVHSLSDVAGLRVSKRCHVKGITAPRLEISHKAHLRRGSFFTLSCSGILICGVYIFSDVDQTWWIIWLCPDSSTSLTKLTQVTAEQPLHGADSESDPCYFFWQKLHPYIESLGRFFIHTVFYFIRCAILTKADVENEFIVYLLIVLMTNHTVWQCQCRWKSNTRLHTLEILSRSSTAVCLGRKGRASPSMF